MTTPTEYEGFEILNPGTVNLKFRITDNEIRTVLADQDIISWDFCYGSQQDTDEKKAMHDRRALFSVEYLVNYSNYNAIITAAKDNQVEHVKPFYAALIEKLAEVSKIAQESYIAGQFVPFALLGLALVPDQLIRVDLPDASHAGMIVNANYRMSMQHGKFMQIRVKIITSKADGTFQFAEVNQYVANYGDEMPKNIGFGILSPEDKSKFVQRGRKYVTLTKAPVLMKYEGSILRVEGFHDRSFRNNGRVMIDYGAMRVMDPSYYHYYGKDDREGNSSDFDIDLDMELEENLLICSPYVYGFGFPSTVWGQMLVDNLSDVTYQEQAFDQLVLDPELKAVILPLVEYTTKVTACSDIIDGKGGGSVFLLNGSSGIGKTLTAEAIAEKLHRPLYSIGCGELGVNTDEIEIRLKNVLDMASSWNAVVLIDEADIFLEQRDSVNIERNAMVGIFLRLIEYYQGVLFLTTNRLASLDKAFSSRISFSVHYPDLDNAARKSIWTTLLELSGRCAVSEEQIDAFANIPLNGRNIKHIVRLATILANSEDRYIKRDDLIKLINLQSKFSVSNTINAAGALRIDKSDSWLTKIWKWFTVASKSHGSHPGPM